MDPYLGEIKMFCGNFAPLGWALCQGQLMNIADNDALYTLLGTTYGGDGIATFALPDLRGRAPFHQTTNYSLGAFGGTETVTLTQQQLAQHTHLASAKAGNGTSSAPAAHYWAGNSDYSCYVEATPNASFASSAVSATGGNQPHDNMMPFIAVSFIIATAGIYPSGA